jgi:hypothetical protein
MALAAANTPSVRPGGRTSSCGGSEWVKGKLWMAVGRRACPWRQSRTHSTSWSSSVSDYTSSTRAPSRSKQIDERSCTGSVNLLKLGGRPTRPLRSFGTGETVYFRLRHYLGSASARPLAVTVNPQTRIDLLAGARRAPVWRSAWHQEPSSLRSGRRLTLIPINALHLGLLLAFGMQWLAEGHPGASPSSHSAPKNAAYASARRPSRPFASRGP